MSVAISALSQRGKLERLPEDHKLYLWYFRCPDCGGWYGRGRGKYGIARHSNCPQPWDKTNPETHRPRTKLDAESPPDTPG